MADPQQIVNMYKNTYSTLIQLCDSAVDSEIRDFKVIKRIQSQYKQFSELNAEIEEAPETWKHFLIIYGSKNKSSQTITNKSIEDLVSTILHEHYDIVAKKGFKLLRSCLHKLVAPKQDNSMMYT